MNPSYRAGVGLARPKARPGLLALYDSKIGFQNHTLCGGKKSNFRWERIKSRIPEEATPTTNDFSSFYGMWVYLGSEVG